MRSSLVTFIVKCKGKGKLHPITCHEFPEGT